MIELDWAEFGLPAVRHGDAYQSVGEVGLQSVSRGLVDYRPLLHPANVQLGLGDTAGVHWPDWPPLFRGHLLLRQIELGKVRNIVLGCIRGLMEQPERPSSRYYSYGLWLVIPEDAFLPSGCGHNQQIRQLLLGAVQSLVDHNPFCEPRGVTEKRLIPFLSREAPPVNEEWLQLARRAQREPVRCVPASSATTGPAEIFSSMLLAAWETGGFQALSEGGIGVYPDPRFDQRYQWIAPRPIQERAPFPENRAVTAGAKRQEGSAEPERAAESLAPASEDAAAELLPLNVQPTLRIEIPHEEGPSAVRSQPVIEPLPQPDPEPVAAVGTEPPAAAPEIEHAAADQEAAPRAPALTAAEGEPPVLPACTAAAPAHPPDGTTDPVPKQQRGADTAADEAAPAAAAPSLPDPDPPRAAPPPPTNGPAPQGVGPTLVHPAERPTALMADPLRGSRDADRGAAPDPRSPVLVPVVPGHFDAYWRRPPYPGYPQRRDPTWQDPNDAPPTELKRVPREEQSPAGWLAQGGGKLLAGILLGVSLCLLSGLFLLGVTYYQRLSAQHEKEVLCKAWQRRSAAVLAAAERAEADAAREQERYYGNPRRVLSSSGPLMTQLKELDTYCSDTAP